jgi:hypothetical protein
MEANRFRQSKGIIMTRRLITLGLCLALGAVSAANADEVELRWSTGLDFTSGRYSDTERTDILYVPVTGTALFGDFTAKVTAPYIRITGPGTVVGGGEIGPINRDRLPGLVTTEAGLGDITASLTYTKVSEDNTFFVDFTGKVKLPTASSAKNLGTGETDYTAQIDLTKRIGSLNLFSTAGYRFVGSSTILPLSGGFLGSVGFSKDISSTSSVGLIYDFRQAASAGASDPSELTGFVSWKLSDQIRLQTYAIAGFSSGSPDAGGGIQISFRR